MAEMKNSEIASKVEELFKEIHNLVNEAQKSGAKIGVVACFSNETEKITECGMLLVGPSNACEEALSEIIFRRPVLAKRATARAIAKKICNLEFFEEETENSNDKFDKAADEISNIIKGLKED